MSFFIMGLAAGSTLGAAPLILVCGSSLALLHIMRLHAYRTLTLVVTMLLLSACGTPRMKTLPAIAAASTLTPPVAPDSEGCRPLRLVIMQDKTGSGSVNRTPQLVWADLQPVLEYIARCGGELAIGTIRAQSNLSLIRVFVPEPPQAVPAPKYRGTPFDIARLRRQHDSALARFSAEAKARDARVDSATASVRPAIEALLRAPNNSKRTDVWGSISRCGYFLNEPGEWHQSPRLVALQISDAIDNMGAPSVPLPEGAKLFLVNGAPSLGALAALHPIRLESITAATRAILGDPR